MQQAFSSIASKLGNISDSQVRKVIGLLSEGATIPFIARYRKEHTGSLDEVQISGIKDLWEQFQELEKRKNTILKAIEEQGKLTEQLKAAIIGCDSLTILEDLYLPYKIKRKTKAVIAREQGLEPLALFIMKQDNEARLNERVRSFLNKDVKSVDDALQGAKDIIAEIISENVMSRAAIRSLFEREAVLYAKVVKSKISDAAKYKDYFDYNERLARCPSHRILAVLRGEEEGFLRVSIEPEEERAITALERLFIKGRNDLSKEVSIAIRDSYQRLIAPSIENEYRKSAKEKADKDAIHVFAENLRQLLLAAPLGPKRILAIDPGFRTGCKVVCLDEQGNLLTNETIFPHEPQLQVKQSSDLIVRLLTDYKIEAIAIGNATAGRETEQFIKKIGLADIPAYMVNESGASVYSASPVAREEFPDQDITVRGAISIGRRLMDPLAELVKIDPKSIGVGQYQHDVDQLKLKDSLDSVVESAVNSVGINLNTASKHLLTYVSGIGPQLAQNIVDYRKRSGIFSSREELKNVPRLGGKAFEQCAGFLRIREAANPLDNSAVHPESYEVVNAMAKDLNCKVNDLIAKEELRSKIDLKKYVSGNIGLPTLNDIMKELSRPGLDPREKLTIFSFAEGISKPEHLKTGMKLPGIITNITKFGAFVDIGVKQDGLVHISNLANEYVSDPALVVKLNQQVEVTVVSLDLERKRIGLSMI